MRILLPIIALVAVAFLYFNTQSPEVMRLHGETMGTTYNVVIVDAPDAATEEVLVNAINTMLADVNGKMSNWDENSEISQFNYMTSTEPMGISEDMLIVMQTANEVHALSDGRFDVTLAPLIYLWGFGAQTPEDIVPADAEIALALEAVGQSRLLILSDDPATLQKLHPDVSINLSAIAKGFGVDQLAVVLRENLIENYLVEIGGDLVTSGLNSEGEPWVIAIERPETASETVELIIPISDLGMATSGDYRNFFEQDGIRYSHLIDPTTGRPITHRATSVTVIAQNSMLADALATALLVLGEQRGLEIAEENNIAAYFIWSGETDFESEATTAFTSLTETQ